MPRMEREMGSGGRVTQIALIQDGKLTSEAVDSKKGYCKLRLNLGEINKGSSLTLKKGTVLQLKGAVRSFASFRQVGFLRRQLGEVFEIDLN